MKSPPPSPRASRAFTLLELILVMSVMVMVIGVGVGIGGSGSGEAAFEVADTDRIDLRIVPLDATDGVLGRCVRQ